MKKIISILIILCLSFSVVVSVSAHHIEEKDMGFSFDLSDNWRTVYNNDGFKYIHNATEEFINVYVLPSDSAYSLEMVEESALQKICDDAYSDYQLSQDLSDANNNAFISVKTNYELAEYETFNGVTYYRYEKEYTASAVGYYPSVFYRYCYITAKNGYMYLYEYERQDAENNFMDFYNMISSVSYELGEIKITINGEKIYTDVSPIIVSGRTFVPIRPIAEKFGYSVGWDEEKELVTLTGNDGNVLHFTIGNDTALKNNSEEIKLDVAPFVMNGRTYLPVRAVAEEMEAKVDWDGSIRTVVIKK